MTIRPPHRVVVRSKLVAPAIPDGLVDRWRLLTQLSADARLTLISAMPGYGKTVIVRQWIDTLGVPTAWLSLDLLDGDPMSFWSHLLAAIGSALPGVGEEPARLLAERGAEDPLFLAALISELEYSADPVVVVLDGLASNIDRGTLEGLAFLVERADDALHIVITSRSDPALPLARWRSVGWLIELREDDLRLTDEEAVALGRERDASFPPDDVVALNQRIDGWPIGLHMALLSAEPSNANVPAHEGGTASSNRLLADYLVTGVLDAMTEQERHTALSLSVLEWFDPAMCRQLVGSDGERVIRQLLGRGMFLTVVETGSGAMKFHALFRELMELELSWRDPSGRIELHRSAAMLWRSRGDLTAAYHHLAVIGEGDAAHELLVSPALEFADQGDLSELRRFARRLPTIRDVDRADLALDLAVVALYADGTMAARRWCERAETLIGEIDADSAAAAASDPTDLQLRLRNRRCAIALLDADLDAAIDGVEAHRHLAMDAQTTQAFDQRFPILAARIMLATRRADDAAYWIARAERIGGPDILTKVCVPTLRAWHEWLFVGLGRAKSISEAALGWMEEHNVGAHHLAFDTLITAGWCRVSAGDLVGAQGLAQRAVEDADMLGYTWQHLQAGYLAAQLELIVGTPAVALQMIEDLRSRVTFDSCRPFADRILGLEIEALAANGTLENPTSMISDLDPGPRAQLLRAQFDCDGPRELENVLADHASWPVSQRLQAQLLLTTRRDGPAQRRELTELVAQCAQLGWVSPFFGLGPPINDCLESIPLAQLHPQLARSLARVPKHHHSSRNPPAEVHLTSRELSLLELLPTHLSYAEIGEQLYLSVNTVKSNLKSLYRKLDARTRREAVEAGRHASLL